MYIASLAIAYGLRFYRCRSVTVIGTTYKADKCCMMIGTSDLLYGPAPQFGVLHDILTYGQEPNVMFVFMLMETLGYDATLGAFEVLPLSEYRCLYRSSIQCHYLFNAIHHGNNRTKYIKSKYDLSVHCNYKILT